ncbi:hypothetical protein TSAR_013325 [Trichomalopsis sarcophagae]|uniref:Uncharacterized protein n=1 Tax=Trichomalopsis sarcophagae TaxID=543379 RepID=A0A232EVB5_9HYME|nr:hypothetical protein TSAR_013325 [Trichomalopsis sarcophagae]
MVIETKFVEQHGRYFGASTQEFQEIANNDYFVHIDTFYYYLSRCRCSPYPLIKRMIGNSDNIALGIITNFGSICVSNNLPEPVQINRNRRFPYDGKYINLSRGHIHEQMKLLTGILEEQLRRRNNLRSAWMASESASQLTLRSKQEIEERNSARLCEIKKNLMHQRASTETVMRNIKSALNAARDKRYLSYKEVCTRESFEHELGLTWVHAEQINDYFDRGYY